MGKQRGEVAHLNIHLKVASVSAREGACVSGHCFELLPLGETDILISKLTSYLYSVAEEL